MAEIIIILTGDRDLKGFLPHVFTGQGSLYNDLVRAPVPDAGDCQAESHPRPGQVRALRPQQLHRVLWWLPTELRPVGSYWCSDAGCGVEIFLNQTLVTSNVLVGESCMGRNI